MTFPFQGHQGNNQNPTLMPNFYRPVAGSGGVSLMSPQEYMAKYPLTPSSGNVVVGGTLASGDVATLDITNGVLGGTVSLAYTLTSSDTAASVAYELAQLVQDNATLQRFGFSAEADPLTATLYIYQASGVGNFSTLAFSATGSVTGTVTQMTGGAGPVTPVENFIFTTGTSPRSYWFGVPVDVNYQTLKALVAQGQPVQ